jgi:hypothetical protein
MLWKRLIVALTLGGAIVLAHWFVDSISDDFITVRPYKSGFVKVNEGSIIVDGKVLIIPMPDGAREVVSEGEMIGYKVFKYGFPLSYMTSSQPLPICTPSSQIPIRIALNITFFVTICFCIFTGLSFLKLWRKGQNGTAPN